MRILCINLQTTFESNCAEVFLKFSPRVQFRFPNYVFVDIESTAGLFGGEFRVLKDAVDMARKFAPQATAAIADTAYMAQVLVHFRPFEITKPKDELEIFKTLPISALADLEGLEPWVKIGHIEKMVSFFQSVGIHNLEGVLNFRLSSFRERWGEVGVLVWKRLSGGDVQTILPHHTNDPLVAYGYFEDPTTLIPLLMEKLEPQVEYLFLRLNGLGRFTKTMEVTLTCEYSERKHRILISSAVPRRDLKFFTDLLLQKLEQLNLEELKLENPIREFEVFLVEAPENIQQADFSKSYDSIAARWQQLISFGKQAQCEMGLLKLEASHFPEDGYSIENDWTKNGSTKLPAATINSGKNPRPSLLLKDPLLLSKHLLTKIDRLTRFPAERIESSWWKGLFQSLPFAQRDYYFALSAHGQLLWIFQDQRNRSFYLHGYFD